MPFPLIKLAYLAIRQISKPLSNQIKEMAKTKPHLRNYVCIPAAQLYHNIETRSKLLLMGLGRPGKITPLNEQMAVDLGADILGEVFVFGTAAAFVIFEYARSYSKASQKEAELMSRLAQMETSVDTLSLRVEEQNCKISELNRLLSDSSKSRFDRLFRSKSEGDEPPPGPAGPPKGRITISRSAVMPDSPSSTSNANPTAPSAKPSAASNPPGAMPKSQSVPSSALSGQISLDDAKLSISAPAPKKDSSSPLASTGAGAGKPIERLSTVNGQSAPTTSSKRTLGERSMSDTSEIRRNHHPRLSSNVSIIDEATYYIALF